MSAHAVDTSVDQPREIVGLAGHNAVEIGEQHTVADAAIVMP